MNRFLFFILLLGAGLHLNANNIEVTDIVLRNQNVGAETTSIQFDLSWENSWRVSVGPANYDAAWVFAKYRIGGGPWRHADLTGTPTAPAGGTVDQVDQAGLFVYRNVDPNAVVDVQVFAVEMVYVPEGAFSLGTGIGGFTAENEVGEFRTRGTIFASFYEPYRVTSEDAITVGSGVGELNYGDPGGGPRPGDVLGPIPATFPLGFDAFYCMKYEMSQSQYVAFFNTLTQEQRENLDVTGTAGKSSDAEVNRNAVSWDGTGNATTTLPDVPLNFVNNNIVLAYLDWAALRPMTETEYEKAGRGPVAPVNNEFAWGTAIIHAEEYDYQNIGTPNEQITNPGLGVGNAIYYFTETENDFPSEVFGPKRCGVLAASAVSPTREETGGSYYGIMELTGNVYERCISVGNPEGRAFTGTHGNGTLLFSGSHNVDSWPADNNTGFGYRGGSYLNRSNFVRLSDRYDAASVLSGANSRLGFRGVRTAN